MSQLPLPFERPDSARRFLVAGPNLQAVRMLERWATWPVMAAILIGPRKSGRTLLASQFAEASNARVIDDAEREKEAAIFHAWNEAQERRRPLLVVADAPPPTWKIGLPDLRSRMQATPVLTLGEPDDELMPRLLQLHFERVGLPPLPDLIAWLTPRLDRTHLAAQRAVEALEAEQSASHARLSIRSARATLIAAGLLPGAQPQLPI